MADPGVAPVRPEAVELVRASLAAGDRVLVTGAGGWFGLTLGALLDAAGVDSLLVTRRARSLSWGTGGAVAVGWDLEAIRRFAPTVVVDCAFVLRDYLGDASPEAFVHANTELTGRLLQLVQLDGLRAVVTVSSGAAVHPTDAAWRGLDADPYGYLKRQAELAVTALGREHGVEVVVARPWSVTGALVTRPDRYAFSDLVGQARRGHVKVAARHEVWRRFTGVDDFFAVVLARTAAGAGGLVTTGGELVEMRELASRVVDVLGTGATVSAGPLDGTGPDDYYPRGDQWDDACRSVGLTPASLDEQIRAVDEWFRAHAG